MGLLGCFTRGILYTLVAVIAVAFIPGIPPKTTFPIEPITYIAEKELKGSLVWDTLPHEGERLFDGQVSGPECLRMRGKDLYLSQQGEVLKVSGKHFTHVASFGKPTEYYDPENSGRPLGFDFDTQSNSLIVADAYFGIWSVDLSNGRKTELVTPEQILPGEIPRPAKLFNSVAIAKNGDIYWTDSSSDFNLINGAYTLLGNPAGRLFKFDRKTQKNHVLLDRIHFANGVVLSPDESFVVVAETIASRLHKVFLTGPKAGTSEVFVDRLPGAPDNLSSDSRGIWVPLAITIDAEHPALWKSLGRSPNVRQFIMRLFYLLELPFKVVHQMYPNRYSKYMLNEIGSLDSLPEMFRTRSTILRLDWNGNIVSSLYVNQTSDIAHVMELDNHLYLGSYVNKYVYRVPVPKGFQTAPAPPPPTSPKEPARVVHEEPTQTSHPPKMKVVKRGGEQGEF